MTLQNSALDITFSKKYFQGKSRSRFSKFDPGPRIRSKNQSRDRDPVADPWSREKIVNLRFYHESKFKNALELFANLTTKTCLFKYFFRLVMQRGSPPKINSCLIKKIAFKGQIRFQKTTAQLFVLNTLEINF